MDSSVVELQEIEDIHCSIGHGAAEAVSISESVGSSEAVAETQQGAYPELSRPDLAVQIRHSGFLYLSNFKVCLCDRKAERLRTSKPYSEVQTWAAVQGEFERA